MRKYAVVYLHDIMCPCSHSTPRFGRHRLPFDDRQSAEEAMKEAYETFSCAVFMIVEIEDEDVGSVLRG